MKRKSTLLAIGSGVLTVTYLVVVAFDITPWIRGPVEWRWAYARPGTLERLWLPALLLLLYAFMASWLHRGQLSRGRVGLAILVATLMTPALQLSLLFMDHPDVRSQLFLPHRVRIVRGIL